MLTCKYISILVSEVTDEFKYCHTLINKYILHIVYVSNKSEKNKY